MRPQESLTDRYSRKIEEEAFLREIQRQPSCASCRRAVQADFNSCPHCMSTLRVPCDACGERMATNWIACAYCGEPRTPAAVPPPDFRRRTLEPVASTLRRNGHDEALRVPAVGVQ